MNLCMLKQKQGKNVFQIRASHISVSTVLTYLHQENTIEINLPYFPVHKTHRDFFFRNFRENKDECILILVIYWKKTWLLHTKINNHNIIYSLQKPRKLSSLPLKSSSQLFSLNVFKFGNNNYPLHIWSRSNLGHIFRGEKSASYGPEYR
jgi:hypothetical protein